MELLFFSFSFFRNGSFIYLGSQQFFAEWALIFTLGVLGWGFLLVWFG